MYGNSYINVEGHAEIPAGVDKIGQRAFMGIKQLKSVSIPNSVSAISWYAFSGCVSLTSITIPDTVKKIGKRCFECCDALTEVVLPDGIKEIGDETFFRCSSLQEVVIPDTVTSIGKGAFSQCSSLRKIVLPKNLKTIDEDAFFEANATMRDVGLLVESIACLDNLGDVTDSEFENSGGNVGDLGVRMTVHRTDLALVKFDLDHHDVVIVTENLPFDSATGIMPLGLVGEDEITALLCHNLFCCSFFSVLGRITVASCHKRSNQCDQRKEFDCFGHNVYENLGIDNSFQHTKI